MAEPRRFTLYVAFDGRDNMLTGTFSASEARTRELWERFNPQVSDFDQGGYIKEVSILIK